MPTSPKRTNQSMELLGNMTLKRIIWFQLLEGGLNAGKPYKGTRADTLSCGLSAISVTQFQEAVMAHYMTESPSLLDGVSPFDLKIYQNKTAFESHSPDRKGKGPLVSNQQLAVNLGTCREDALIVVINATPAEYQLSACFSPCVWSFFNRLPSAIEQDRWLWLREQIPSTTQTNLYIRESYRVIAAQIQPGINKTIITGTPGTGKTLFLIYLLWQLVRKGKRVLFIYSPYIIYYDGHGGIFSCNQVSLPPRSDRLFWNADLWCLFDVICQHEQNLGTFSFDLCTFVVSSSPQRDVVNAFQKPPTPRFLYMPLWTETELEIIAPSFPDVINWRCRFELLGGVPRDVLESVRQEPAALLQDNSSSFFLDELTDLVGFGTDLMPKSKYAYHSVHITSASPFTESSVSFASQAVLRHIVTTKVFQIQNRIVDLLASSAANPLAYALCEAVWKPHVLQLLEAGGSFRCRQLAHEKTRIHPFEETTLVIPYSLPKRVDRILPGQSWNQLHVAPNPKAFRLGQQSGSKYG